MPPLSSRRISGLLNSFRQANPHIRIEVADGHCDGWCRCDRLFGPLAEGERDAVLSIVNDRVAVKFASQVLFEVPYMLAVPADHRFAQQQAVNVGELANEPLILPEYCGFLQDVTNALAPLGESMRIVYRTDHDDRALALVAAGLGLALLPGQFDNPDVRHVPVSDLGVSRKVGLVWQRGQDDSAVRDFLTFAEHHRWSR